MIVVLDASALLAYFQNEPGKDEVAAALERARMSAVNAAEVCAKLSDAGLAQDEIALSLRSTGIEFVTFDVEQSLASGALRPATRAKGLSLGDRACLGLALTVGAKVLTADRNWAELDLGIDITLIR